MSFRQTIVGQFRKPHGVLGSIAGWVMANRDFNLVRNRWTVDLLNIRRGDRILEIGCGPGLALAECLARNGEGRAVGLDHSQTMLDQARARLAKTERDGRADLQFASLEDLSETAESFDKIYSVNVVQFLSDRAAAFRKIFLLLKPGGIAATTYMPRGKNPTAAEARAMADEVRRHMTLAGFSNIRTEELPLEPVPAVCVLGERR